MLADRLEFYWNAFWTIAAGRPHGFNGLPLPISLSEIVAWCALAGIFDPVARMDIAFMVQAMDDEYLSLKTQQSGT